ncbi:MAG: hypothetical protein PUA94_04290 [Bacteroidales bacterium]|nr:hypothetical protein [Bacteroidales bacterium]
MAQGSSATVKAPVLHKYVRRGLKSTILLGSLDWEYDANNVIFRGACQVVSLQIID